MALFSLMFYDKDIAIIKISGNDYDIVNYEEDIEHAYRSVEDLVKSKLTISSRPAIKNMLSCLPNLTLEEFANWTHCVSVTDSIWLKVSGENTSWKDVSPFRGKLDERVARAAAYGIRLSKEELGFDDNLSMLATTASVHCQFKGDADKSLLTDVTGKINMFKSYGITNEKHENVRTYMESVAYGIAKQFGADGFVNYNVFENRIDNGDIRMFSGCKIFTGERCNLVPLSISSMHNYGMKQLMGIIDGVFIDRVCDMMIVDSLVLNTGRSRDDIGLIYDARFNIVGIAPIFDFDSSLGWDVDLSKQSIAEAVNEANSKVNRGLKTTFDDQAASFADKLVAGRLQGIDADKIDRVKMNKCAGLSEKRREFVRELIKKRVNSVKAAVTRSRIRG